MGCSETITSTKNKAKRKAKRTKQANAAKSGDEHTKQPGSSTSLPPSSGTSSSTNLAAGKRVTSPKAARMSMSRGRPNPTSPMQRKRKRTGEEDEEERFSSHTCSVVRRAKRRTLPAPSEPVALLMDEREMAAPQAVTPGVASEHQPSASSPSSGEAGEGVAASASGGAVEPQEVSTGRSSFAFNAACPRPVVEDSASTESLSLNHCPPTPANSLEEVVQTTENTVAVPPLELKNDATVSGSASSATAEEEEETQLETP